MAMAALLRPNTIFFSTPRCSPPPSSWPSRRGTPVTTRKIRSSSKTVNESSFSYSNSTTNSKKTVKLTYLGFNGWEWELDGGVRILVDPVLIGNLVFGTPWLFEGAIKQQQDVFANLDLASVDLLLITSGLSDHSHLRTLAHISSVSPHLPVVTTPNARSLFSSLPFTNTTYLEPGQSTAINGGAIEVLATPGVMAGPPWQRPENGYVVTTTTTTTTGQHNHLIHYEPHCVYNATFLDDRGLRADVIITPVVKIFTAGFPIVRGQEDTVDLATLLQPSFVVPVSNYEYNAKGLLMSVLTTEGTIETFKALLREALPQAMVMEPTPGVPLHLHLQSSPS